MDTQTEYNTLIKLDDLELLKKIKKNGYKFKSPTGEITFEKKIIDNAIKLALDKSIEDI